MEVDYPRTKQMIADRRGKDELARLEEKLRRGEKLTPEEEDRYWELHRRLLKQKEGELNKLKKKQADQGGQLSQEDFTEK